MLAGPWNSLGALNNLHMFDYVEARQTAAEWRELPDNLEVSASFSSISDLRNRLDKPSVV